MIIKVCGLREPENLRAVEDCGADWTGLISYPRSPRHVPADALLPPARTLRWGVFVNAPLPDIVRCAAAWGLRGVQLHGQESPALCRALRRRGLWVMKALGVRCAADLERAAAYAGSCHYLLFDTPCPGYGGSGRAFSWQLLRHYRGPLPFLLSGGIGPHSLPALAALRHPLWAGIDVNSRFEYRPGLKNTALLGPFIAAVRQLFPRPQTFYLPSNIQPHEPN